MLSTGNRIYGLAGKVLLPTVRKGLLRSATQRLRNLATQTSPRQAMKKVAVIGSGNFGSVIARNIARNAAALNDEIDSEVKMWVHDELVQGRSLVDIINKEHVNVKYLPGINLTPGVVACADIKNVCHDADVLVFVVPHQFLRSVLSKMKGHVKPDAIGVSLTKSIDFRRNEPVRCSTVIKKELNLPHVAVVMGANIAHDIAVDNYAEATVASSDPATANIVRRLFESKDRFHTDTTTDAATVEFCGALKNVVAVGAGIAKGIKATESARAALMRQGLQEMSQFCREFHDEGKFQPETMLLSCGVADLIATCHSGRNSRCGAAFARELAKEYSSHHRERSQYRWNRPHVEKLWAGVIAEVCDGQYPPGTSTAGQVFQCLLHRYGDDEQKVFERYPLFTRIYEVACEGHSPYKLFKWTDQ